ncbi:MAG: DUF2264 domain-containing protein [Enhygromyxa sp.]
MARPLPGSTFALALALLAGCPAAPPHDEPTADEPPIIELDPALDFERSPQTGFVREHHVAVFARLCLGFVDHRSEQGARTNFGGSFEASPESIEGVTRMLLGLGYWLENPDNPARIEVEGRELDLLALAREAVLAGTHPSSPDFWDWHGEDNQRAIEAGLVAEFLLSSRARLWDGLSQTQRDQIMAWLRPSASQHGDNRTGFALLRNLAREQLGYAVDPEHIAGQVAELEGRYLGDGFYGDGSGTTIDYYNAFVIHHALLSYVRYGREVEPQQRERIVRRARTYAHHLWHFIDAGGAPIAHGRSLGYRMAMLAPLLELVARHQLDLPAGALRELLSSNLRFFLAGGSASSAGMLDARHVLLGGWLGDDLGARESYMRPGSQYYALRGFAALALPADHELWTSTETSRPRFRWHAIPAAGLSLFHADAELALLATTRSDKAGLQYIDLYRRTLYSSRHFVQRAVAAPYPYDGSVTVSSTGELLNPRGAPEAGAVAPGFVFSVYELTPETQLFTSRDRITTAIASVDPELGLLRVSCVRPHSTQPATLYEGSLALPDDGTLTLSSVGEGLYLESSGGAVQLSPLFGFDEVGVDLGLELADRLNFASERGSFVGMRGSPAREDNLACVGSFMRAAPSGFEPAPPDFELTREGSAFTLRRGDLSLWFRLGDEAPAASVELDTLTFTGPLRHIRAHADTIVALGLERIEDSSGVVFEFTEGPGTLWLERGAANWTVVADRPFALAGAAPESARVFDIHQDQAVELGELTPALFDEWQARLESTLLRFEIDL